MSLVPVMRRQRGAGCCVLSGPWMACSCMASLAVSLLCSSRPRASRNSRWKRDDGSDGDDRSPDDCSSRTQPASVRAAPISVHRTVSAVLPDRDGSAAVVCDEEAALLRH